MILSIVFRFPLEKVWINMEINKIKSKFFALIELIITFKWRVSIFLLILPILILIAFFILLDTRQSNLFFLIVFLLNYYIAVFILILIFSKSLNVVKKARSPFYFIKNLHFTQNKSYWDKYKQPLKHLTGAEIGVYKGDNAKEILNFLNIEHLVLVDPWKGYDDYCTETGEDDSAYENYYKEVKNKFSNNPKVRIIRDTSVNAAKMFDDEYFDFVYLDCDHSYESVTKDLESWYPKLKKFGVMCADDYGHPSGVGVIEAVTKFAYRNKLLVNDGEDRQFWFVKV